jgi:hypothetical protein
MSTCRRSCGHGGIIAFDNVCPYRSAFETVSAPVDLTITTFPGALAQALMALVLNCLTRAFRANEEESSRLKLRGMVAVSESVTMTRESRRNTSAKSSSRSSQNRDYWISGFHFVSRIGFSVSRHPCLHLGFESFLDGL